MPERKGSFNVFGAPTLRDVKVGYISTETGYVSGVGLWDANVYAKKNPGTTFIFNTRDKTQYLNINEVNKLTVDDLPRGQDGCGGAEIFKKDSEDKDPKIIFSGGGGVGAKANPVIGQDGSLLGVHLVSGGFGYKYPPHVSIEDPTGYASGAVIRCGIGTTVTTYQTYEDEEDFEEYFPPHIMKLAPPNIGFGDEFIAGKNIGPWNPYKYVDSQQTPFETTVKNYMKELREVQSPWWTTHEAPSKVTGDNRTTKTFYKVHHWAWGAKTGTNDEIDNLYIKLFGRRGEPGGLAYWKKARESGQSLAVIEQDMKRQPEWKKVQEEGTPVMSDVTYLFGAYWEFDKDNFMNSYAISPVPMSNSKASDFSGRWYTFEWDDVEFPYDGEYNFRVQCDNEARFFLDNQAVSEFKIGAGGAAGSVLSNPLHFKETIKKGKHSFKLELYNHPKIEDVTVQEISTRQEVQVAGGDFILKSNGYHLAVGGNEETELVLTLEYNDNPRTAGTAVTKITIPNPNGPDLVLEREKDSNGNFKTKGSVSAKGVFKRSEFGYGPFIVEGNSGSTKLVRQNLTYGVNSVKYGQIDFLDSHGSDINGSLKLVSAKNLQESRTIIEAPLSSESTKFKTVFNTVDYINKANRKLWRINSGSGQGFINDYGICPFDTTVVLPDNPYSGTHEIRWFNVNFPVSGNYIIEIQVDDNVNLRIGDEVEIRKEGFTIVKGRYRSTGKLREVHYIKEGTYNIFAGLEQIPGGKFGFGKGLNPMALAINITTAFTKEQRVKKESWTKNPMGVAMTIDAPNPPIPQQPKPVQEGRCPPNPFWTTRFPGGTAQWHPVYVEGWSKFLNKHAMSPVPPYDIDSTSGGGVPFENEWTVDIPYDGFYKLKGSADDNSQFYIDDKLELETKRSGKVQDETMVFLNEGTSKIRVVVENYLFEEKNLIDQKIFNAADWANAGDGTRSKTQLVDFNVTTSTAFINSIEIKGLFYEQGPKLIAGEDIITPPPQVKPAVDADVEFIKRDSNYFMKVSGNDLVEVGFDFRYIAPPPTPDPEPIDATMKFVKKSGKYFLQVTGNYLVDVALEFRYFTWELPAPTPAPIAASMLFVKKNDKYYLRVTGNDLVDVALEFRYHEDDPNLGDGHSVTSISVDTEGTPLTFTKSDGPRMMLDGWPGRGGAVTQNGTFKNGKEYEVTFNKLSVSTPIDATMRFIQRDGRYFFTVTGNDLVDVALEFRYSSQDPSLGGGDSVTSITIQTENDPLTYTKTDGPRSINGWPFNGGIVTQNGTFKNGEEYEVTFDTISGAAEPMLGPAGSLDNTSTDNPDQRINFFDNDTGGGATSGADLFGDARAYFTATSITQLTDAPTTEADDPIIGPAGSLDNTSADNPNQRINFFDIDTSGGATSGADIFGDARAYLTATTITQLSQAPTIASTESSPPIAVTSVTIQTENDPIVFERTDGPRTISGWPGRGGIVTQNGTFLNGKEYEVTFDKLAEADDPIIGPAGSLDNTSTDDPDQRINFFDTDTSAGATSGADYFGDARAYFTATSITQLSNPPVPASTAEPVAIQGITIQTNGSPLTFRRTDGPRDLSGWPGRGGSVVKKAIFKNGVEYPISFTGRVSGSSDPIIGPAGSLDNVSQEKPKKRINFFGTDTSAGATSGPDLYGDVPAHFTATNIKQLSTPEVQTFESFSVAKTALRQLDGKPTITRQVEMGREYIVEVKNAGAGLMGNYPAPVGALKADGGVLMLEDIPNVASEDQGGITFDDLVCKASHGKFYDIKGNICKFKIDSSEASVNVQKGTVTYDGPKLYRYAYKSYGEFMKKSGVAPDYPVGGSGQIVNYVWSNIDFPADDTYKFVFAHDAHGSVYLDGKEIIKGDFDNEMGVSARDAANWDPGITKMLKVTKGKHQVAVAPPDGRLGETSGWADGLFKKLSPDYYRGQQAWNNNPSGMALSITRKVDINVAAGKKPKHKSWKQNPVGVSGILIPPPCPKVVGGTGVVIDPRPIVPGNGFRPPTGPGYPVGLKLTRIDIDTPGINYNPDDPVLIDNNGGGAKAHICEMDSYGRIKKICLDDDNGVGVTERPRIRIPSPTGSGFRGIPIIEIVPDPVDPGLDRDKLLQVTDLVGIKQTGYYDGRPYYGAIFYKDGVKYAGYYETAGQLVQIYDTLQESIDAQVTTPASAILRQGTDISSDNPRLDIPGTPDNLT